MCSMCHVYWRGDKRLLSVSHVLRSTWPFRPDYSAARPEVIENARDRGVAVDALFTSYVRGHLQAIPRGTRTDAVELFFRLKRFYDERKWENVESQVILADDDIAGTCDLIADDWIYDLKTTHDIEPMYQLQLGAYAQLFFCDVRTAGERARHHPRHETICYAEAHQDRLAYRITGLGDVAGMLPHGRAEDCEMSLTKPARESRPQYKKWIKAKPCLVLSSANPTPCLGPNDPHHVVPRSLGGSDYTCVPLCRKHHDEANNKAEFESRYALLLKYHVAEFNKEWWAMEKQAQPRLKKERSVQPKIRRIEVRCSCGRTHKLPPSKIQKGRYYCITVREFLKLSA